MAHQEHGGPVQRGLVETACNLREAAKPQKQARFGSCLRSRHLRARDSESTPGFRPGRTFFAASEINEAASPAARCARVRSAQSLPCSCAPAVAVRRFRFRVRSCLLPSCADNAPLVRAPRLASPLRCPSKVAKIHTLAYIHSAEVLIWLQSSAEFS